MTTTIISDTAPRVKPESPHVAWARSVVNLVTCDRNTHARWCRYCQHPESRLCAVGYAHERAVISAVARLALFTGEGEGAL